MLYNTLVPIASSIMSADYTITKTIKIRNNATCCEFVLVTDEYGSVIVNTLDRFAVKTDVLTIPKNCIQHLIDALEQLK